MTTWLDHVEKWRDCTACPLHCQRSNICLARGSVPCAVLFIGEAPGQVEDALGQPFRGPAGRLLDQIIWYALPHQKHDGYYIEDSDEYDAITIRGCRRCHKVGAELAENPCIPLVTYALTNLVACFPAEAKARGDNEPELSEIKSCRPRLMEFIDLCKPKLVVCVGSLASDWVQHDAYGKVRGADAVAIVHPAAILRMPLAQKQMAVQRCIIQIRNAVDAVIQCEESTKGEMT